MKKDSFDIKDFRRALGKFPTGVTIITGNDSKGEPLGVTASSFNSVSIDPPLVLWSVDKGAFSAAVFQDAEYFAVNVLSKMQVDMSNRFAGRGEDKFKGVSYKKGTYGSPLFQDCAAQFECKTWKVYEGGDHFIIVGEVLDYSYTEEHAPLVFAGGSYGVSMQHPSTIKSGAANVLGNGFLSDYLLYLLRIVYTNYSAQLYPQLLASYNITPEEWRVLTLLADIGQGEVEPIANTVGQPVAAFQETFERMQEKSYVVIADDGQLELSDSGRDMAEKVFALAREQEEKMLADLTVEQQSSLKVSLKKMAEVIV